MKTPALLFISIGFESGS